MRYAALAFGVLAGLVASLILALGGLDPSMLPHFDPRQESVLRFGLFVVASFGVLGAGVVLASPLAGGILFVVGAIAWIVASVMLRHGPDYVLITPPVLLLLAFGFALFAFLRPSQPRRAGAQRYYDEDDEEAAAAPVRAAMSDQDRYEDEDGSDGEQDDEPSGTPVRAGFFGQGGTAMPARVEAGQPSQPALQGYDDEPDDLRSPRDDNWRPGSRRPPPRQQPLFRDSDDEDDEDEESGFSRFARGFSSIASFGLYAALAGAAVLVFVTWRSFDGNPPAAAKIDAQSSTAVAVSSAPPAAPVLSGSSSAPAQVIAATQPPSLPATNLITAAPTLGDSPMVAPAPATLANTAASEPIPSPGGLVAADTPPPVTSTSPDLASASSDAPASADQPAPTPTVGTPANPMPFPMLPQMAAERAQPSPKPAATAPVTPKPAAPKPAAPKPAAPKPTTAPNADAGI